MAQFDIYRLAGGQLVCDLQTDLIAAIGTRLVAPMLPVSEMPHRPALMPLVLFAETRWVVVIPQIGAVPDAALRNPIGTLAPQRDALKRALDMLIDGV